MKNYCHPKIAGMPQKEYLTVQLGSYEPGPDVLNLLLFPNPKILPDKYRISVKRWSEGETYRNSFNSMDKMPQFLKKISTNTFNFIGAKIGFEPYKLSGKDIKIDAIYNVLYISPLNSLWGKASGYLLDNLSADSIRSDFEYKEIFLRHDEINKYPTLLESQIVFESSLGKAELLNVWFELLKNSLRSSLLDIEPFGCADVSEMQKMLNILQELTAYSKTYGDLDKRFDEIHDYLIGREDLCKQLTRAVGEKAIYTDIKKDGTGSGVGLVCLLDKKGIDMKAVADCFVKRDSSTDADRSSAEGEYKIGNTWFHTQKRYQELLDKKLIPTSYLLKKKTFPGDSHIYFPVIKREYIESLGIDPDDLLMDSQAIVLVEKFYSQVDKNYDELSYITDEKEKIWKAHEKAYEILYYSQEQIDFIKKMHFDGT